MNLLLLAAGIVAAVTAGVHILAGHFDPVRPLLGSDLAATPLRTMHAVWHLVSVDLTLTAVTLCYLALASPVGTDLVALLVAARFLGYAGVFLAITMSVDWSRPLLRLPQWMLLLPVAALSAAGVW